MSSNTVDNKPVGSSVHKDQMKSTTQSNIPETLTLAESNALCSVAASEGQHTHEYCYIRKKGKVLILHMYVIHRLQTKII